MPKKKTTISEFKQIAESRGGICLSKEFTNWKTKLTFKCKNNHIWSADSRESGIVRARSSRRYWR